LGLGSENNEGGEREITKKRGNDNSESIHVKPNKSQRKWEELMFQKKNQGKVLTKKNWDSEFNQKNHKRGTDQGEMRVEEGKNLDLAHP